MSDRTTEYLHLTWFSNDITLKRVMCASFATAIWSSTCPHIPQFNLIRRHTHLTIITAHVLHLNMKNI